MREENIWYDVSDKLPDTDQQHGNMYESEEVLLFLGDTFVVDRYFYHSLSKVSGWRCTNEEDLVEKWCYIKWPVVERRDNIINKVLG